MGHGFTIFLRVATLVILIAFGVVATVYDHYFMRSSAEFSADIQDRNNKALVVISDIFSTPLVYWVVVYLHFYTAVNRDIRFMLYLWTCLLIPMTTCYLARPVFYHGRPYTVN